MISQTAIDCWSSFAQYLGNVICCPQYEALLHILVGESSKSNGLLALNSTFAEYCFSDVQTILVSQGANASLPSICSALPSNLTEGSCPVKGVKEFEQTVNGSKLLIDCKTVDPVKECCSPVCQPAISEAARRLALKAPGLFSEDDVRLSPLQQTVVDDCHRVVLRWLSSQLTPEKAKSVLRGLSNCNVNRGTIFGIYLILRTYFVFPLENYRQRIILAHSFFVSQVKKFFLNCLLYLLS